MRFENQVALVTGAASGIGRALVRQLVAEGAAIAFLASKEASNVNGAILPADYGWSAV